MTCAICAGFAWLQMKEVMQDLEVKKSQLEERETEVSAPALAHAQLSPTAPANEVTQ